MPIEIGTKITFFPAMLLAGSARTPVANARLAPIASPTIVRRNLLPRQRNISSSLVRMVSQIADRVGFCVSRIEIVVGENRRHEDDAPQHVLNLGAEVVKGHAVAKDRDQRGADEQIAHAAASASKRNAAEHN